MAEKPKLKDTGEILDSIGKTTKQPAILPTDLPAEGGEEGLFESQLDSEAGEGGAAPAPERRVEDRNPLDIGKYDLKAANAAQPRRRGRPRKNPAPVAPEEAGQQPAPPTVVKEYKFESLDEEAEEQQAVPAAPEQNGQQEQPAPRRRGRPRKYPLPEEPPSAGDQPAPRRRGRPRKYPLPEEGQARQEAQPAQPPEPETLLEERDPDTFRDDFRKMLANRFDQEFSQRFEGRTDAPKAKTRAEPPEDSWFEPKPKGKGEAILPPEDDQMVNEETEEFIHEFERKVRQEEEQKAASFKDTLAQKFMRERERYLKDLGIMDEMEREAGEEAEEDVFQAYSPSPEPTRRRLDLQIQPEMHMQEGELPPSPPPMKPVTYGPGGAVREQVDEDQEEEPFFLEALPRSRPQRERPVQRERRQEAYTAGYNPGAKKSSEELLMELARQNAARQQVPRRKAQPRKKKKALGSYFGQQQEAAVYNEPAGGKKKMIFVGASTIAAILVLALIAGPVWGLLQSLGEGSGSEGGYDTDTGLMLSEDTLTVYESRNPDEIVDVGDILIKKSGISLRNYNVASHVVIGEIESTGEILLQDMTVGGTIYVRSCGVNLLRLENVTADRVVVNNQMQQVSVQVIGDSDVGTVEIKSPAAVMQAEVTGDAAGVENILASKADETALLSFGLDGLQLRSLTLADSALVEFSGNTSVELLSVENGTITASGDGRVLSLSAKTANTGGEAATLTLRDLSITTMSVDGPSHLNLTGSINMLTVADDLYVEGDGAINVLMIQGDAALGRVSADLWGTNVSTVIADNEAIVRSTGSGRIAELTANQSVYALGNKVGHLIVNANNVIYEEHPDKITTASGVRQAEALSDNPNLDLNLPTNQIDSNPDVSGDDIATTCEHSRELGGFLVGDGSVSNPFQVSTPAQLAHVNTHMDSHFVQTADIDFSEDSAFASGFTPLGGDGTPFSGSYDGMGYVISNLRISSSSEYVGLFAENTGTIQNVHIISGEVQAGSGGRAHVGSIVGLNSQGGLVEACSNGARISGASTGNAGGIAGSNYGRIRDTYNYAKISGNGTLGGVAGSNRDGGSIVGSYSVGTIDEGAETGGVVGVNSNATVTNCYYLADTAEFGVGAGGGSAEQRSFDQMTDGQMALDLAAGDVETLWIMPSSGSYDYPVLASPPRDRIQSPADDQD